MLVLFSARVIKWLQQAKSAFSEKQHFSISFKALNTKESRLQRLSVPRRRYQWGKRPPQWDGYPFKASVIGSSEAAAGFRQQHFFSKYFLSQQQRSVSKHFSCGGKELPDRSLQTSSFMGSLFNLMFAGCLWRTLHTHRIQRRIKGGLMRRVVCSSEELQGLSLFSVYFLFFRHFWSIEWILLYWKL